MSDINLVIDSTPDINLEVSSEQTQIFLSLVGAQGAKGEKGDPGDSGTLDHGALTGLADDDHSQYHNDARGDARYYTQSQVDSSLAGKANVSHTHAQSDITNLVSDLAAKANVAHSHNDLYYTELEVNAIVAELEDDIGDKANIIHTHAQSEITNLVSDLSGKASISHTHAQSDVTELVAALAGKEGNITAGTTSQYWRGDKTFQTLNKSAVGLSNVDNTSDATKNSATATLTNKTISGSNNTLSNIPNSALSTNPLDRTNHTGSQAISTVSNLQSELNTRFKILGKGTPLLEVYTDVFEEVISFQLPAEFMDESGNVVVLEMFMSWSEDSAHEIEIRLQDESANDEQIGLYVSDTTPGQTFLGRVTVTFIALAGALVIGIVEVNGLLDGATQYAYSTLAFASDGAPFDLTDLLTIQVNMRVPDNLSSIQSVYALASTKMELG